ncbi:MAG: alpha/beta hydrolase [Candidatus Marinimicrobia bacterium]|nr:alpha/beta hydrolase [Candidatus Neomarinimicrobiota bacterium]
MKEKITRRELLKSLGLLSGVLLLNNGVNMNSDSVNFFKNQKREKHWYEFGFIDPILDQVFLYYLNHSWQKLADVGEVLQTVSKVDMSNPYSWAEEWMKTSERLENLAKEFESNGHNISAGECYLRSSNYFIAALHRYPNPYDKKIKKIAIRSFNNYKSGIKLLKLPIEVVNIPYEGKNLPGYLFKANVKGKAPILIVHQGRDGWAEQCKYIGEAANKRGMHCLIFDGPGIGKGLRILGLPFRPDWEKVITPVVDFVSNLKFVDRKRIGLMGISMGGSLTPRAVAFEKRISFCIANPGVYRWSDIIIGYLNQMISDFETQLEKGREYFNRLISQVAEKIPLIKWGIADTMWKHGVDNPYDLIIELKKYTNEDVVDKIKCKFLVVDSEKDEFSQAKLLYEKLKCPKDYLLFTEKEAAELHCQTGSLGISEERIFNWVEKNY